MHFLVWPSSQNLCKTMTKGSTEKAVQHPIPVVPVSVIKTDQANLLINQYLHVYKI